MRIERTCVLTALVVLGCLVLGATSAPQSESSADVQAQEPTDLDDTGEEQDNTQGQKDGKDLKEAQTKSNNQSRVDEESVESDDVSLESLEEETETKSDSETDKKSDSEVKSKSESEQKTDSQDKSKSDSNSKKNHESEAEPKSESQTKSDSETKTKSDSETKTKSDSETKTKSESDSKTKSKSDTEPKSESKSKPKSESETESKSESGGKQKSESKHKSETKQKPEPETNQKLESETKPKSESEETKSKSESETEPKSESEETKPKSESEETKPKSESETKPKSESETKPKSESETEPKSESETKPKSESETKPKSESETNPKSESESKTEPEPQSETKSEPESEAKTESESKPKSDSESETKSESESKPKSESGSKTEPGPESETKSEPEIKPKSESESMTETDSESEAKPLCEICKCPADLSEDPYKIDCSSLNLTSVPAWDSNLDNISDIWLDFSSNRFRSVPLFDDHVSVSSISFAGNVIVSVTANAFTFLPRLKSLSLAHNQIENLHHSAFCGQKEAKSALESLDLNGNALSHLDDDLFECTDSLEQLGIGGNRFNQLDTSTQTALNSLHNLKRLDLSGNDMSNLPKDIINPIGYIEALNLAGNSFKNVPNLLEKAGELRELNLDQNPIEELNNNSFKGMVQLTTLNINYMPLLKRISKGTFQPLVNLKYLNCSNNENLHVIEPLAFNDEQLSQPKDLQWLNLQNNNLTHLTEAIFINTHAQHMDIRGNPLACTCDIYWITVKGQMEVETAVLEETTCYYPLELRGTPLNKVQFKELHCSDFAIIGVGHDEGMSSSSVFLLTVVIIGLFLTFGLLAYLIKYKGGKRYRVLGHGTSVHYSKSEDNHGFESINCDEIEEYSRYPIPQKDSQVY